jgi:hypothetical protein
MDMRNGRTGQALEPAQANDKLRAVWAIKSAVASSTANQSVGDSYIGVFQARNRYSGRITCSLDNLPWFRQQVLRQIALVAFLSAALLKTRSRGLVRF